MHFHKEILPIIKQYKDKVFRAYDGYGATIIFDNDLSIHWDINDESYITRVKIESENFEAEGTSEQSFSEILSMIKILAASETEHQEARKKIDKQYAELVKKINIK